MDEIRESIEDLIEETCLRALTDDQVERRIRRFTEICEQTISGHVENTRTRQMLLERLEIMKCFYNHSSVQKVSGGAGAKEISETARNKRLENIVRRRRMALQMIEKADANTAHTIQECLEKEINSTGDVNYLGSPPAPRLRRMLRVPISGISSISICYCWSAC